MCGDLIRVSVSVDGATVRAGFAAEGCGALTAAGSALVTLVDGAPLLTAARVGAREISAELGGLSPGKLHAAELAADALHRALGAAAAAQASLAPDPARTLVAMSGGVDSAVAALLVARTRETVAVTLELWADPANDAEASCCSAVAVRVARGLAHRMGMAHLTLDLRDEFRAGVVDPFLAGYAAGETPNPCINCNGHVRLDAMLDLADRLGAADLATGHYARRTADGLLRTAADPAKDQAYMLSALKPASLARMRFPLAELTKPEVRALAAEADLPVASKAESMDLCFLAGTGKAAFLARHGGLADAPGEIVDSGGTVLGSPPRPSPLHRRPAQGPRRPRRRAALRAAHRGGFEPGRGRLARRARHPPRARARRPAAPPGERGRRRAPALSLARRALPRGGGRGAPAGAGARRALPRRRAGPGRVPAARRRHRRLGHDRHLDCLA